MAHSLSICLVCEITLCFCSTAGDEIQQRSLMQNRVLRAEPCSVTSLNLGIRPSDFLHTGMQFLYPQSCYTLVRTELHPSPDSLTSIYFSCLIAAAKVSSTLLTVGRGCPVFMMQGGKHSFSLKQGINFYHFPTCLFILCGSLSTTLFYFGLTDF